MPLGPTPSGTYVAAGTGVNVEPTAATIVLSTRVTGDTNDRFTIGADGKMSWGPGNGAADTNLYRSSAGQLRTDGGLIVGGTAAGVVQLVAKAAVSQTADLTQWQNSAGTVLANLTASGNFNFWDGGVQGLTWGGAANASLMFTGTNGVVVVPYLPSYVGFTVKGKASQTADLQQWQNSAGTNLARIDTAGNARVAAIGSGLAVAEGANAKQGISAAMTAGSVVVANTSVTANSRIILTRQDGGAAPGAVYVSARTPGTSFTIASTSPTDTGTVAYQIFEPA